MSAVINIRCKASIVSSIQLQCKVDESLDRITELQQLLAEEEQRMLAYVGLADELGIDFFRKQCMES